MYALSFGELLWDIIRGNAYIGGAPFNLAGHLAKMGLQSFLISSVGSDDLGMRALEEAKKYNVYTSFIKVQQDFPTGTVEVSIDSAGHPEYIIHENTAWDNIVLSSSQLKELEEKEWMVFSFGTLAQRTENNRKILKVLFRKVRAKHTFYDVNIRQNYYSLELIEKSLSKSSIVKLNSEEVVVVSELLYNKKLTEREFTERICGDYDVFIVCITRGARGCAVHSKGDFMEVPGISVDVADTVGAGDSFSAGFLFALLSGKSLFEAAEFAVEVGAFVASRSGAIPEYSSDLKERINNL